jgi:predicted regulator of Ras-like GTPase activity (Roadblock/LC7/MglB family)
MDTILQGLHDLDGVQGTFLFNASGQILRFRAHSIYDQNILEQASRIAVKAIDSLQLQHSEWDQITAQFSEGKLLIRNIGEVRLAVIADASLNPSFANVAIRVAVTKLKQVIQAGGLQQGAVTAAAPPVGGGPASESSRVSSSVASGLTRSGLTWSGISSSGAAAPGMSSAVSVTDENTSDFLTRCSKALAKSVGPMAKVFVKEAVRKIAPISPFASNQIPQLVAELETKITDPEDKAAFRKALGVG